MTRIDQSVSFDQMKGAIGSLVFLWSEIERALGEANLELYAGEVPKSVRGISKSLTAWSQRVKSEGEDRALQTQLCGRVMDLLAEALAVRNLVCHGLKGISVMVDDAVDEAHLTVQLDGDERILTWSELQEMFSWMSRSNFLIRSLTAAAMEANTEKAKAMLAGLENFSEQR